jgi:hypothetical protein
MRALLDQVDIANVAVVWVRDRAVLGVQSVIQYPWHIVPMGDPENECFLWIEWSCHHWPF